MDSSIVSRIKGISIIESLVCVVVIGIAFIAINQVTAFSVASLDRSIDKTKINFLSEMAVEDMLGDKVNIKDYSFSETCNHNKGSANSLSSEQKNKWRDKFNAANQIKINGVEKKPKCLSGDGKSAYINSSGTTARFIYKSRKGKNAKYLAVGIQ
tara:strand:+ start:784 stop:1248 length:465 start_codon:yes stop_codon:yes gene_type:complete